MYKQELENNCGACCMAYYLELSGKAPADEATVDSIYSVVQFPDTLNELATYSDPAKLIRYLQGTHGVESIFHYMDGSPVDDLYRSLKSADDNYDEGVIAVNSIPAKADVWTFAILVFGLAEGLHYMLLHKKSEESIQLYNPWSAEPEDFNYDEYVLNKTPFISVENSFTFHGGGIYI